MPLADIIGGAQDASGASSGSIAGPDGPPISRMADSAGDTVRYYLNEFTPRGVEWTLNFAFIVTVLSAASSAVSLWRALG